MKAVLTDRKTKFSTSHRKEKAGLFKCYAMLIPCSTNPGDARAIAELRIYWPANNPFACLWVYADNGNTSGSGTAGGGGYCKAYGAASDAISNAGFDITDDQGKPLNLHGAGMEQIRESMKAIAAAVGHPEAMLFETHP